MRQLIRFLALLVPLAAAGNTPLNDKVPLVLAAGNADKDWLPTTDQVRSVMEQSRRYFQSRDAGRYEQAYAMYAPTPQANATYRAWRKSVQALNTTSGGITGRQLVRITWYKDPPNARPGVYAAVDFSSASPKLALHCGYVVWREEPGARLAIVREEDNILDKPTSAQMAPAKLAEVRKAMHC